MRDIESGSLLTRQSYLKDIQYRNASNLEARINLHKRFSTQGNTWHRWVYDHLHLSGPARVLEVGCGPGELWMENLDRLPTAGRVVLADLSTGMVGSAAQRLGERVGFDFTCLDAQAIAFPDGAFDLVIANHMLYHIPDLPRGVSELARVLKPGGWLCAATNGEGHMLELHQAIERFKPGYLELTKQVHRYSLQTAERVLGSAFMDIDIQPFHDSLLVTEIEPLQAYILSMTSLHFSAGEEEALAALLRYLEERIREEGQFYIGKEAGIVLARPIKP